jgi:hypothetical protein
VGGIAVVCGGHEEESCMAEHDHHTGPSTGQGGFLSSRAGIVLVAFLVIVGLLLTTEHRAHAFGAMLWLLILACPLLHIFMHGGHEGHTDDATGDKGGRQSTKETTHEH